MNDFSRRALFGLLAGAPVALKAAHIGESRCRKCGRWQDDWFFNHGWQLCEQCTDNLKPFMVAHRELVRAFDRLEKIDPKAFLDLTLTPEWRRAWAAIDIGPAALNEVIHALNALRDLALKSLPS